MSNHLSDQDLRTELGMHATPLIGIRDTNREWFLGLLSISKRYPSFRSGYSHPLHPESVFRKQWFELDGRSGWAIIFDTSPAEPTYFAGWVPKEKGNDADAWVSFLNREIADRLREVAALLEGRGRDLGHTPKVHMKTLKTVLGFVGEFRELGYAREPDAPSLADALGKRRSGNKVAVVKYLRSGAIMVYSPGLDTDVLDARKRSDTPSIFTDGVYAWRELVAYYVDRYDVELPIVFEAHMEGNGWRIPESIDVSQLTLPRPRTTP